MITSAATTTNCTIIRIRVGIVFLSSERITLENAVTAVTERAITMAGSIFAVTARAEHIPRICTRTGLFLLKGPSNKPRFLAENNVSLSLIIVFVLRKLPKLLVGEIEFLSNGEVYAILSVDPTASVRDALSNPSYNLKTDIFDKKLNNIPHFDLIYQYIVEHDLRDIIVEFALFDKEVGIKKEKVIVYELRTHY